MVEDGIRNTNSVSPTGIFESFCLRKAAKIFVCCDSVCHDLVGEELQCAIEKLCRSVVCKLMYE